MAGAPLGATRLVAQRRASENGLRVTQRDALLRSATEGLQLRGGRPVRPAPVHMGGAYGTLLHAACDGELERHAGPSKDSMSVA